ncbi:nitroreductase, partial [candidate division MSBL1 archaeon SCGC-AAA259I14]
MNVDQAMRSRRAVRNYKDKEVSRRKIEKIMDAVRNAPSADNRQDWQFIFVKDEEKKRELSEKAGIQSFVRKAPIIIAGVTTRPESEMTCGVPAGVVDLSIALDHLTLKAVEEELGTCWI